MAILLLMADNARCNPNIANDQLSYRISDAASSAKEQINNTVSCAADIHCLKNGDVFKGNVAFVDPHLNPAELSFYIVEVLNRDVDQYQQEIEAFAVIGTINGRLTYGFYGVYDVRYNKLDLYSNNEIPPDNAFAADAQTHSIHFEDTAIKGKIDDDGQTIHLNLAENGSATLRRVDEAFNLDKAIETAVIYIKAYEEEMR